MDLRGNVDERGTGSESHVLQSILTSTTRLLQDLILGAVLSSPFIPEPSSRTFSRRGVQRPAHDLQDPS